MLKAVRLPPRRARAIPPRRLPGGQLLQRILLVLSWIFVVLYALAVALFLIGRYGWFGATPDPLSAVFLIPLGLPWIFAGDVLPVTLQPYFSIASPLVNLAILRGLAALAGRWKAHRASR
jgi:hypothetical protein